LLRLSAMLSRVIVIPAIIQLLRARNEFTTEMSPSYAMRNNNGARASTSRECRECVRVESLKCEWRHLRSRARARERERERERQWRRCNATRRGLRVSRGNCELTKRSGRKYPSRWYKIEKRPRWSGAFDLASPSWFENSMDRLGECRLREEKLPASARIKFYAL